MIAWVIESIARDPEGNRVGMFRWYVATEARAAEKAAEKPGATYRRLEDHEIPPKARAELELAAQV